MAGAGALTLKCVAASGWTVMLAAPVMALLAVSAAVIVWIGAVLRVERKVLAPVDRLASAGSEALASVLEKWMVPVKPVAVLSNWSWAVIVTVNAVLAPTEAGAVTLKCVAAWGLTVMPPTPAMALLTVSAAMIA